MHGHLGGERGVVPGANSGRWCAFTNYQQRVHASTHRQAPHGARSVRTTDAMLECASGAAYRRSDLHADN